jgi:hypothetical protein
MRHPVHFSTQQYTSLSTCLQYNTLISPLLYNTIHQSVHFSTLRNINLSTYKHSNTSDSPFLCTETHQFCLQYMFAILYNIYIGQSASTLQHSSLATFYTIQYMAVKYSGPFTPLYFNVKKAT